MPAPLPGAAAAFPRGAFAPAQAVMQRFALRSEHALMRARAPRALRDGARELTLLRLVHIEQQCERAALDFLFDRAVTRVSRFVGIDDQHRAGGLVRVLRMGFEQR